MGTPVVKALGLHLAFVSVLSLLTVQFFGITSGLGLFWGGALSTVSLLGLVDFLESVFPKKGIALVFMGSVLRYGILILVLALNFLFKIQVPVTVIVGLFLWIPSSLICYWVFRKRKKSAF